MTKATDYMPKVSYFLEIMAECLKGLAAIARRKEEEGEVAEKSPQPPAPKPLMPPFTIAKGKIGYIIVIFALIFKVGWIDDKDGRRATNEKEFVQYMGRCLGKDVSDYYQVLNGYFRKKQPLEAIWELRRLAEIFFNDEIILTLLDRLEGMLNKEAQKRNNR